jgi:hypothetical protein
MSAKRVVVCARMGDGFGEMDASHLWPFVPRVGDTVEWEYQESRWEGVVQEVVVHLDPGESDPDVWVGLKDEKRTEP